MLQYKLLKLSPRLLRFYRSTLLLDFPRITSYLPVVGKVLDVGCGVGIVSHRVASERRDLNVLGIDISAASIELARVNYTLPNTRYECKRLEAVTEQFDCVMLLDVLHHIPPSEYDNLFNSVRSLLAPGGYLLVKDIERRRGYISFAMDRYISGCKPEEINLHNCDEMTAIVSQHLRVKSVEIKFRFPFPNYYIVADSA